MHKNILLSITIFFVFQDISVANSNEERLDPLFSWLHSFNSLSGTFKQTQSSDFDGLASKSAGEFAGLKPSYFLWHQTTPDDQLVLSDAEFIWHYDKALETVARRKVSDQMSSLQILLGDSNSIRNEYSIVSPRTGYYHLIPRNPDSNFQMFRLHFNEAELSKIEIVNRIGQEQTIKLSNLNYNPPLTSQDFVLNAPENAELLYNENF